VPSRAVPGFLPSRYGFRFRNEWAPNPVRTFGVGPLRIPFGNAARGLCGGMVFAARDRFERGEDAPLDAQPPAPETPLFREIVDRQFASFGFLLADVPFRFWRAAALGGGGGRERETALRAWPAIRAEIDAGRPAMVGLIRLATWNPLAPLGHQVVGFRYDETAERVEIGVYDPNHPGLDNVSLIMVKEPDGTLRLSQSTDEKVLGLLALPFEAVRG
jgi:hypothetical protein